MRPVGIAMSFSFSFRSAMQRPSIYFERCKGHTHKGHREKVLKVIISIQGVSGYFQGVFPYALSADFSEFGVVAAPYCAIPRDYLSDTPLLRAMGLLVSQHDQFGAVAPPPFLSLSPLESMRSGGPLSCKCPSLGRCPRSEGLRYWCRCSSALHLSTESSLLLQREEPFCVLVERWIHLSIGKAKGCSMQMLVQRERSMLVQNQTTFSASHVQAYWAHLDHVVYKKEVLEHKA